MRDADLAADAIGLAREQVLASVGASLVGQGAGLGSRLLSRLSTG